eukprot:gene31716-33341_t
MKVALLLIACSIAAVLPPVRADYAVYKSGTGCQGSSPGDCNLVGQNGKTCYACDPMSRNHNVPPGVVDKKGREQQSCTSSSHRNHYCADKPAYVPNAPTPPPTKTTTTKTKTATETSLTTTSATTTTTTAATTTEWQAVADTCAWTCQEPGGCGGCPHHQGSNANCNTFQNCFRKGVEGDMEACEKDLERQKQEANCFTTTTV